MLRGVDGPISELVQLKLDAVLRKNEGLEVLKQISAALSRIQTTQPTGYNHTPSEVAAFKYAPLVSADVERSFSRYKAFLRN